MTATIVQTVGNSHDGVNGNLHPDPKLPLLKRMGRRWELLVDGKPFLILGGELQNSSATSARYMNTIWQKLVKLNINTILATVSWEDIEPEEDHFSFGELDSLLAGAREHGFRMILVWFGSFKNGMSCYAPPWVKLNPERFPRMQCRSANGSIEISNVISILHDQCVEADAKAFGRLMQHLKENDNTTTVIMVQVENEVGLLGDSRDRSKTADETFSAPVPAKVLEFLEQEYDQLMPELKDHLVSSGNFPTTSLSSPGRAGSWEQHFGQSIYTDELFMAYHYALYVEKVAATGKLAYDIPLFTNVWLPKPGSMKSGDGVVSGGGRPGEYPSGGAVSRVLDVWQRFTPTLHFIAPDIYTADYSKTCSAYCNRGQPLFIPEQHRDDYGARRIWEAVGRYGALGASPFGVDTLDVENADLAKHYKLMGSMAEHILKARLKPGSITGFFFDELDPNGADPTPPIKRQFTAFELLISRAFVFGRPGSGFGIIIELDPSRFLLIGKGYKVEFKSTSPTSVFSGILRFEEKSVVDENGTLQTERILNGDESRSGKWANMPNEKPDLGGYIPISIPGRTFVAEVTVYSLEKTQT